MQNRLLAGWGGHFRPTESIWSISSKVAWANCLTGDFMRSYGTNLFSLFRVEEFAACTGIPSEILRVGMGKGLVDSDDPNLFDTAYRDLRFCPSCLRETGFHSVLFQFPLFSCCPVHSEEALRRSCVQCGRAVPYSMPSSSATVFRCPHCASPFWNPVQQRFDHRDADEKFEAVAKRVNKWWTDVVQYAGSSAPIRHWVDSGGTSEFWIARGLPELNGVFSPRALRGEPSYWGGVERISKGGVVSSIGSVYDSVIKHGGGYCAVPNIREWIAEWHSGRTGVPTPAQWAYVGWRAYWEGAGTLSDLTNQDDARRSCMVEGTAKTYFHRHFVGGEFGANRTSVNMVILRELLKVTLVASVKLVSESGGQPSFANIADAIRTMPGPIFLIKPLGIGVSVEWVHQKEFAPLGRKLFGKWRPCH